MSSPKRITRSSAASSSSSASRMAVRKAMAVMSESEREGSFEQLTQPREEARSVRAIDDTVVAAQGDGHDIAEGKAVRRFLDRRAPRAADREDRDLRRVDDRGEGANAEHPEVRDGERAVVEVLGLQRPPPRTLRKGASFLAEL